MSHRLWVWHSFSCELVYLTVALHVGIVPGRPALARELVGGHGGDTPPPLLTVHSIMPVSVVISLVVAVMVVLQTVQQIGLECVNDKKF